MNVLFYLVPKTNVIYLQEDDSIGDAMKIMQEHRYTSVPLLSKKGKYVGCLSEGDILWGLKERGADFSNLPQNLTLGQFCRHRDNKAVNINCAMEDLLAASLDQNFIPVVDDSHIFIGIVTRKSILTYCMNTRQAIPLD